MEMYGKKAKQGINWITTIFMVLFHIGAVAALFFFSWKIFFITLFLWWVSFGWGIGVAYHRLLTHRDYKTPKWVEYLLTICATLSMEGGPIFWVATHRIHHQKSDQDGDPHSPRDGAWWAHVGWILFGETKHANTRLMSKYAPDLAKDPFYVWLNNYHWVPILILSAILFAIGGWSMFLWGTCMRVFFGLHATWLVNSATHMWGKRRFTTRDDSRNNWWVALLTFGEVWHNNHHAHPTSARHGLDWDEIDFSWLQIKVLRWLRIAKSVHIATVEGETLTDRKAA